MKISIRSFARYAAALSLATLAACGGFGSDAIIGGSLSGLGTGLTVVLTDNGGDNLSLTGNGSFAFATKLAAGDAYSVAVLTQPVGQTCTVGNAAGTVNTAGSDVNNITVACATSTLTVTVTGLTGTLVLSDALTQLSISSAGSFAFPGVRNPKSSYTVTIVTQPAGQACTLSNATGTVPTTGIVTVAVTCT